ncbi:hypothetical protein U27_02662 [Candidatus Vecturithrix granuli]|uniref:Uncharacterized protein n=1 Tax=Vecturithrix granuli TaxID=1499967 RepID=A0A081BTQ0_VECG1|nr:hypothetical protein U27_02662 [Candidatus Vecturithrix granuli]
MFSLSRFFYLGILILILLPCVYFLVLLAQQIFLQVIMFRRIDLKNMTKHQAGLFYDERKATIYNEFLWLVIFAITLEYANTLIQAFTVAYFPDWSARELTIKSLLCLYLWSFAIWQDYHRWKDRIRTGQHELLTHCRSYLATLWLFISIMFLFL